jgi:exonuclease SbcD
MNKPIAIFSNDWHLKKENKEEIIDLVTQKCKLAKELGVKYLICLGDIFDSRVAQREEVLNAFGTILDTIKSHELELWALSGNHDKCVYSGYSSFLDPFKDHPNFNLGIVSSEIRFNKEGIFLYLLPFFQEEMWIEEFEKLKKTISLEAEKHILCTHIAVTGSRNNDGTTVSSILSTKLFKDFYKVFSGHYHNSEKVGSNFYHLPSIQQNNFGENADKGFTVLYSDGSHELVKSKFKEYIKVKIDLDSINKEELALLKKKYKGVDSNIRFEFVGSDSVLKSLKKEDFTSLGIDVKTKSKEIEDSLIYSETEEVKEHTSSSIKEEFEVFCKKEELSFEQGIKYLNIKLK